MKWITDWRDHPTLKEYILKEHIADGGFSEIWLGQQRLSGEQVCIKVVYLRKPGLKPEDAEVLRGEARFLRNLEHPNILRCSDVFETRFHMVMVLEFLSGGEMLDHLHQVEHYSEAEAARLFVQIVGAVAYLHNLNILHRDIKPENILFARRVEDCISRGKPLRVKLIDLGMAAVSHQPGDQAAGGAGAGSGAWWRFGGKAPSTPSLHHASTSGASASASNGRSNGSGSAAGAAAGSRGGRSGRSGGGGARRAALTGCMGSPGFIAPEVCMGGQHTFAMDVYSLGVLLFIMLTGRKPWSLRDVRSMAYARQSIAHAPGLQDPSFNCLSPGARSLLLEMLADRPEARPTAAAVLRHPFLMQCLQQGPAQQGAGRAGAATGVAPRVDGARRHHQVEQALHDNIRRRITQLASLRRFRGLAFAMMSSRQDGQPVTEFIHSVAERRKQLHKDFVILARTRRAEEQQLRQAEEQAARGAAPPPGTAGAAAATAQTAGDGGERRRSGLLRFGSGARDDQLPPHPHQDVTPRDRRVSSDSTSSQQPLLPDVLSSTQRSRATGPASARVAGVPTDTSCGSSDQRGSGGGRGGKGGVLGAPAPPRNGSLRRGGRPPNPFQEPLAAGLLEEGEEGDGEGEGGGQEEEDEEEAGRHCERQPLMGRRDTARSDGRAGPAPPSRRGSHLAGNSAAGSGGGGAGAAGGVLSQHVSRTFSRIPPAGSVPASTPSSNTPAPSVSQPGTPAAPVPLPVRASAPVAAAPPAPPAPAAGAAGGGGGRGGDGGGLRRGWSSTLQMRESTEQRTASKPPAVPAPTRGSAAGTNGRHHAGCGATAGAGVGLMGPGCAASTGLATPGSLHAAPHAPAPDSDGDGDSDGADPRIHQSRSVPERKHRRTASSITGSQGAPGAKGGMRRAGASELELAALDPLALMRELPSVHHAGSVGAAAGSCLGRAHSAPESRSSVGAMAALGGAHGADGRGTEAGAAGGGGGGGRDSVGGRDADKGTAQWLGRAQMGADMRAFSASSWTLELLENEALLAALTGLDLFHAGREPSSDYGDMTVHGDVSVYDGTVYGGTAYRISTYGGDGGLATDLVDVGLAAMMGPDAIAASAGGAGASGDAAAGTPGLVEGAGSGRVSAGGAMGGDDAISARAKALRRLCSGLSNRAASLGLDGTVHAGSQAAAALLAAAAAAAVARRISGIGSRPGAGGESSRHSRDGSVRGSAEGSGRGAGVLLGSRTSSAAALSQALAALPSGYLRAGRASLDDVVLAWQGATHGSPRGLVQGSVPSQERRAARLSLDASGSGRGGQSSQGTASSAAAAAAAASGPAGTLVRMARAASSATPTRSTWTTKLGAAGPADAYGLLYGTSQEAGRSGGSSKQASTGTGNSTGTGTPADAAPLSQGQGLHSALPAFPSGGPSTGGRPPLPHPARAPSAAGTPPVFRSSSGKGAGLAGAGGSGGVPSGGGVGWAEAAAGAGALVGAASGVGSPCSSCSTPLAATLPADHASHGGFKAYGRAYDSLGWGYDQGAYGQALPYFASADSGGGAGASGVAAAGAADPHAAGEYGLPEPLFLLHHTQLLPGQAHARNLAAFAGSVPGLPSPPVTAAEHTGAMTALVSAPLHPSATPFALSYGAGGGPHGPYGTQAARRRACLGMPDLEEKVSEARRISLDEMIAASGGMDAVPRRVSLEETLHGGNLIMAELRRAAQGAASGQLGSGGWSGAEAPGAGRADGPGAGGVWDAAAEGARGGAGGHGAAGAAGAVGPFGALAAQEDARAAIAAAAAATVGAPPGSGGGGVAGSVRMGRIASGRHSLQLEHLAPVVEAEAEGAPEGAAAAPEGAAASAGTAPAGPAPGDTPGHVPVLAPGPALGPGPLSPIPGGGSGSGRGVGGRREAMAELQHESGSSGGATPRLVVPPPGAHVHRGGEPHTHHARSRAAPHHATHAVAKPGGAPAAPESGGHAAAASRLQDAGAPPAAGGVGAAAAAAGELPPLPAPAAVRTRWRSPFEAAAGRAAPVSPFATHAALGWEAAV